MRTPRDLLPAYFPLPALTASVVVVFFAWVQWRGIVWGDRTQQITSLIKTLLFFALIVAAFVITGGSSLPGAAPTSATPVSLPGLTAFVLAMQAVIYTYDGWNGVLYFSEECRTPEKDIPRSMLSGVASVIVIYVLVNVAFLHVLG